MQRNLVVGIVAACAIGCLVGFGGTAIARAGGNDDGKDFPPTSAADDLEREGMPAELWERQSRLVRVARGIEGLVDPTESGRPTRPGMDGYLLVEIDLELNSVELFWKGDIPVSVRNVIAADPNVRVRTHRTAYSETEYLDSQAALVSLANAAVAKAGRSAQLVGIQQVGDREGCQVSLYDPYRVVRVPDLLRDYAKTGLLDVPIDVEYCKEQPSPRGLSG